MRSREHKSEVKKKFATEIMTLFRILFLMIVLVAMFSGCATNQNSQQSTSPTVSGSISVGAQKNF
jgi:uncharacterized lipoprotein YajG